MKIINNIIKITLALVIILSIFQVTSFAANEEIVILQEQENKYLIYISDVLNENFEFSFSKTKDETTLNYISSAKDDNGNNIAYVDGELKNNYFDSDKTYMWVKTGEKTIINGEEITLNNVITKEEISTAQKITKSIKVEAKAEDEKIKINGQEGKVYYYIISTIDSNKTYEELNKLVDEINSYNEKTDVITKLTSYKELYKLYNILIKDTENQEWAKTENLEITKPYGAKENQQYILWLKDSDGNIDIQLLTAYEENITKTEKKETTQTIITATPNTYDETTVLVVALGIIIVAIIAILVIKKVQKSSDRG